LLGVVGAILGFMCFNCYPAKIFMGDTGSLAIGGMIAVSTALTRQYFLMCIIGILFVITAVSVVIQVVVFKLTNGKRVFKMSPLHHHFEVKHHESKITTVYAIVTMIVGIITIAIYL
jgi:phospho-N-acetylmuramoyl-pentapeptide-transferase